MKLKHKVKDETLEGLLVVEKESFWLLQPVLHTQYGDTKFKPQGMKAKKSDWEITEYEA